MFRANTTLQQCLTIKQGDKIFKMYDDNSLTPIILWNNQHVCSLNLHNYCTCNRRDHNMFLVFFPNLQWTQWQQDGFLSEFHLNSKCLSQHLIWSLSFSICQYYRELYLYGSLIQDTRRFIYDYFLNNVCLVKQGKGQSICCKVQFHTVGLVFIK